MKDTYFIEDPLGVSIGYVMGPTMVATAGEVYLVTGVRTHPKFRNHGFARRLLQMILDDADREVATLILSAQSEPWDNRVHPGLTQDQLEAWYLRHDFHRFVPTEPWVMRRFPKEVKHGLESIPGSA